MENTIEGIWVGNAIQSLFGKNISIPVLIEFKENSEEGILIMDIADMKFKNVKNEKKWILDLQTMNTHNGFVLVNYRNKDATLAQFGSITFKIDNEKGRLDGYFTGYGPESQGLVYGAMILTKSEAGGKNPKS
jgi:hypothetical protein